MLPEKHATVKSHLYITPLPVHFDYPFYLVLPAKIAAQLHFLFSSYPKVTSGIVLGCCTNQAL